jgi:hypothetical protein
MKTAALVLSVAALAGCGPAPVSVSTSNNEIGRYQIYQARNPGDPQQVLVMKLDTVTGAVEHLDVAVCFENGPDGYADMQKPVLNKDGSFYGTPYWRVMYTTLLEADRNTYRSATNQ